MEMVDVVQNLQKTVEKWQRRVSQSSADYKDGVQNPSRDWEKETLAAKERYEQQLQAAISEGRREKGIRATGSAGYKDATVSKAGRWADGVSKAQGAFSSSMSEVLAFQQTVQNEINAMPNATDADREARMLHQMRRMREFRAGRR